MSCEVGQGWKENGSPYTESPPGHSMANFDNL